MVAETRLYDILSITPNATVEEISKAYKRIALKCHPDKTNHDPQLTEKFKQVTRAYEILKDVKSRGIYDKYGDPGLSGSGPSTTQFTNSSDILSQMWNQMERQFDHTFSTFYEQFEQFPFNPGTHGKTFTRFRPAPGGQQLRRGKDIYHTCHLQLGDLAYGKTVKLQLDKKSKCRACFGDGGFGKELCRVCRGRGHVITTVTNEFSQYQGVGLCEECHGNGFVMSLVCTKCDDGYVAMNQILEVNVLPGTEDGEEIVMKGAADEGRNVIPGDVIIKIKQQRHPYLIRRYNDLYMEYDIDLKTALVGGSIVVKDYLKVGQDLQIFVNVHGDTTLNGILSGPVQQGEIVGMINSGTPKLVKGMGMPINRRSGNGVEHKELPRGDLFIKFNVQLPSINEFRNGVEDLEMVARVLPSRHIETENAVTGHLSNIVSEFEPMTKKHKSKNGTN